MIAVVVLSSKLFTFRSFIDMRSGAGLPPSIKITLLTLLVKKEKHNEVSPGVYFFEIIRKT